MPAHCIEPPPSSPKPERAASPHPAGRRHLFLYPALVIGYVAAMALGGHLRPEHIAAGVPLLACCYLGPRTRRFMDLFLPFFLAGAIYDLQWLIEPHLHNAIHVAAPYLRELRLFGFLHAHHRITANQFFARHHWPAVDLATGFGYFFFVYEPLVLLVALLLLRRPDILRPFGWTFLGVNVVGLGTAMLYPAAPPWYVAHHGLGPANPLTKAYAAGALRFDHLLGIHYFRDLYERSADVFGSVPSLHVAGPLIVFLYARHLGKRWVNALTLAFYLLVCFSAVYLQHHYIQDVLLGSLYALTGYAVERGITALARSRRPAQQAVVVSRGGDREPAEEPL